MSSITVTDFATLCLKAEILKLPHPLIRKGLLKIIDQTKSLKDISNFELTPLGLKLITGKIEEKSSCVDWIEEYRALFKEGKGKRGDKNACIDKMCRFTNTYGFSKEDIFTATKAYLDSLHGDYTYCMQADYFIFKKAEQTESSKLLTWIEEVQSNDYLEGDWTKKMI